MCGRFYIAGEAYQERSLVLEQVKDFSCPSVKTAGEIFPSDQVPVFIKGPEHIEIEPMIWGFPRWDGRRLVFNARQESALGKKMFRQSLLDRRAAVLSSGFFEWTPVPGRSRKDRYLFVLPGEKFLFLAAFWSGFSGSSGGEPQKHFTILTTEANDSMRSFHSRMPVILAEAEVDDWLSGSFEKYLNRIQAEVQAIKI